MKTSRSKTHSAFHLPDDPEGYRQYLRKQLARRKWMAAAQEPPTPTLCSGVECSACGEPAEYSGGLIADDSDTLLCLMCWTEQTQGVENVSEGSAW